MKNLKLILICLGIILLVYFFYNSAFVQRYVYMFNDFINPKYSEQVYEKFSKQPSGWLLRYVYHSNPLYWDISREILTQRQDKRLTKILLNDIKSSNVNIKSAAYGYLGKLEDLSVIPELIKVVEKGVKDSDYYYALETLAMLKYQPVYQEIIKLANSDNLSQKSSALYLLKKYFPAV